MPALTSFSISHHKEDEVRSRMLIDELNHRVKNTLSTVQSIVWQTLRTTTDPQGIRQSIKSRLFALSRSHDLLTREKWKSAGLRDIAHDALEPFGADRRPAKRCAVMTFFCISTHSTQSVPHCCFTAYPE